MSNLCLSKFMIASVVAYTKCLCVHVTCAFDITIILNVNRKAMVIVFIVKVNIASIIDVLHTRSLLSMQLKEEP